jgi:SNF2 family DNA or RNA helicase
MPNTKYYYHLCYNPIYKTIEGLVSPKISEMISAGNIQGVIKALGGKETDNITDLVKKKKLDDIREFEIRLSVYETDEKNADKVLEMTVCINKLRSQIKEIDNRYKNMLKQDCNICMEKLDDPVMEPNCQNLFCGKCLLKWLINKPTCPLCRTFVSPNQLVLCKKTEIDDNINVSYPENMVKTKINISLELISKNPKNKFIIFSAWDQTFLPIREMLLINKIKYVEVKGSIGERQRNIDYFKNGDVNVIFLNSRFNGAGINLQEATDIIIYHEMDSYTINQVIGRANRISRINPLSVHYLQIE